MKKVLIVIPSFNITNGVTSFLYNYLSNMELSNLEISIIGYESRKNNFKNNFIELGCTLYSLPSTKRISISNKKYISNIIKNGNFDIIHCNVMSLAKWSMFYAKKYGIPRRILHSHQTMSSAKLFGKIYYKFNYSKIISYSNQYLACSELAGYFMFPQKKFEIIYNAINVDKFKENLEKTNLIRINYHLEKTKIIGFVGRIDDQKNLFFLIDVFEKILTKDINYKLMIVGTGKQNELLKKYVIEKNLTNSVIFVGEVSNVWDYYHIFDVFVMTSLFEGLPVVGIEAQFSNCPCVFSSEITTEVKISDEVCFVDLIDSLDVWADKVIDYSRRKNKLNVYAEKYNIKCAAEKLFEVYAGEVDEK